MSNIISGQKTVTSAGTAVTLGSQQINGTIRIKALDTNSGIVAVGNDGADDVTVSNGYRMAANEDTVISVGNLAEVYLDSAVNGEGVSWLKLNF
jgi:hypothetical protein